MLTTYRVVIYLRASTREQVKTALEAAFGPLVSNDARIYEVDPNEKPIDVKAK